MFEETSSLFEQKFWKYYGDVHLKYLYEAVTKFFSILFRCRILTMRTIFRTAVVTPGIKRQEHKNGLRCEVPFQ